MADFFKTSANLLRKNNIIWMDFYLNLANYFLKNDFKIIRYNCYKYG